MDDESYCEAVGTAQWLEEREVDAMSEAVFKGVAHALKGLKIG